MPAPVPPSVPGLCTPGRETPRFIHVPICPDSVLPRAAEWHEVGEDVVKEEAEPRAFAASCWADAVHAVVPVAAADEGETVGSGGEALVDRPNTVFEECPVLEGHARLTVRLLHVRRKNRCLQERRALVQRAH